MLFIYALLAVTIVSLLSLLGAFFITFQRKLLDSLTTYLLAFSSGILLGTTFYDLIPEGFKFLQNEVFTWVIAGIVTFFILEKIIHWHSHIGHRDEEMSTKTHVAVLTLVGDGIHNFLDGAIIGVTFLTSIPLGIATTIAVIAHEIPHELSDFFLLIYGGLSNKRALWYNFLSGLTSILGTIIIFIFSKDILVISPFLIGFGAGNFLYIAASDLIPELHQKHNATVSVIQTVILILGIVLMWTASLYLKG